MDVIIICSVVGFLLGMIVNEVYHLLCGTAGILKIKHTEEKDLYLFEIGDLDSLNKKKHVTLKVVHSEELSQK